MIFLIMMASNSELPNSSCIETGESLKIQNAVQRCLLYLRIWFHLFNLSFMFKHRFLLDLICALLDASDRTFFGEYISNFIMKTYIFVSNRIVFREQYDAHVKHVPYIHALMFDYRNLEWCVSNVRNTLWLCVYACILISALLQSECSLVQYCSIKETGDKSVASVMQHEKWLYIFYEWYIQYNGMEADR